MNYDLYTLPGCEKCAEVKATLDVSGVKYREISLENSAGKDALRRVLDEFQRTIERGANRVMRLPVIVRRGDSGIEEISQGAEGLRELLLS